ncbi:hypothetical protein HMPREF9413_0866 [Paenibacillus sp. HGF7]|nr:hypothetical protein HMPREF9413_0866 [Paenibacillus sp. HGF7]EPD81177.1 hypothetical protein HMPREF1207_04934 [Paenibacillus sp. HGH0039]
MMDALHHGSESTSSSEAFLNAVSPQIVVISQTSFQSPNLKERLEKKNANVYSTGLNGNILLTSDGSKMEVLTEKDGLRLRKANRNITGSPRSRCLSVRLPSLDPAVHSIAVHSARRFFYEYIHGKKTLSIAQNPHPVRLPYETDPEKRIRNKAEGVSGCPEMFASLF